MLETHGLPVDPSIEVEDILQCELDSSFNNGKFGELLTLEGLDDSQKQRINSGKTVITASNAIRKPSSGNGRTLVVDPLDVTIEESDPAPIVEAVAEEKPMLILYTVALDVQNDQRTSAQMADEVFGVNDDPYHLKNAIEKLSKGKVSYIPACSRSTDACFDNTNIINGVMECNIQHNIVGVNWQDVGTQNINYANGILSNHGLSTNNFNIFHVISRSADFQGAAAWGQVGGRVTWYRDDYSWRPGVQIHEIGHNLGMRHSGHGSASYADHHCSMGNPSYGDDGPMVAWNGQKAWYSGWYAADSQQVDVANGDNFDGLLVGIGDYVEDRYISGTHKVVLRIPDPSQGSTFAYYMLFNRKEGANSGVNFNNDKLIVVEGANVNTQSYTSGAFLDVVTPKWQIANFNGSGRTLTVEVCSVDFVDNSVGPDTMRVLVYLDNDLSCSVTESPSALPTISKSPTAAPSKSPTQSPIPAPSKSPTGAPTKGPTTSPTLSRAPTRSPTQKPVKSRPTKPPKNSSPTKPPVARPTKPPKGGKMIMTDCVSKMLRGFLGA